MRWLRTPTGYVSPKAEMAGKSEGSVVILGSSRVGSGTFLAQGVIVGYPGRSKLLNLLTQDLVTLQTLDQVSAGSAIGNRCVVRSGSVIYEEVEIADDVETGHGILIRAGSRVGAGSKLGSGSQLDGKVTVGRNTNIQSQVYLPHGTVVGKDVFIAPRVCVTNDPYPPSKRLSGVTIHDRAVIGGNATLLAGITIGEGAVIGAGAVVTKDVEPETVVFGAPAKPHMTRHAYDKKKSAWEVSKR